MAAAAKMMDARARSLKLAKAHGHTSCSQAARTLGWTLNERGALVSLALEIASATALDRAYAVGYLAATDDASCDCQAAQYGRPCWHRGLGILCGREVAKLYGVSGRAQAERAYRADLAAQENARALGYR